MLRSIPGPLIVVVDLQLLQAATRKQKISAYWQKEMSLGMVQ